MRLPLARRAAGAGGSASDRQSPRSAPGPQHTCPPRRRAAARRHPSHPRFARTGGKTGRVRERNGEDWNLAPPPAARQRGWGRWRAPRGARRRGHASSRFTRRWRAYPFSSKAARMAATTASGSSKTSLFSNRSVRMPCVARTSSRARSRAAAASWSCGAPSSSIASDSAAQKKSSTCAPTEAWRLNRRPSIARRRSSRHSVASAGVSERRSARRAARRSSLSLRRIAPEIAPAASMHATARAKGCAHPSALVLSARRAGRCATIGVGPPEPSLGAWPPAPLPSPSPRCRAAPPLPSALRADGRGAGPLHPRKRGREGS